MSKDEIILDAEIVGDLDKPSKAEQWLAAAREKVDATAAEYHEWSIQSNDDYKQMKRDRAEIRKRAQLIDGERKSLLADMEKRLSDFKADVKDVLAPLTSLDVAYKAELDAWDARIIEERRIAMASEYRDGAPDLAELVPIDLLAYKYASAGKWWNKSTTTAKATEDMWEKIQAIGVNERALEAAGFPADVLEGAKARYFADLEFADAMLWARKQVEKREQVAELERKRKEREEEAKLAAQQREAEQAKKAEKVEQAEQAPEPAPAEPQRCEQQKGLVLYIEITDERQVKMVRDYLVTCQLHGIGIRATRDQFESFRRKVKEGR